MTGFLAPQIQSGGGVEAPVQGPSFQGLAQSFNALFGSSSSSRTTQTPQGGLQAQLVEGLTVAAQYRENGQNRRAESYERTLITNYLQAGGEMDSDTRSIISASSGTAFDENYWLSFEEKQRSRMLEDETYQTAYSAQRFLNPGGSEEDWEAEATLSWQRSLAASQVVLDAHNQGQIDWERNGKTAMSDLLTGFHNDFLGTISVRENRGIVTTPEYIDKLKNDFTTLQALALYRPEGVTDEQWRPIQSRIDSTQAFINNLEEATSTSALIENFNFMFLKAAEAQGQDAFIAAQSIIRAPETFFTLNNQRYMDALLEAGPNMDLWLEHQQVLQDEALLNASQNGGVVEPDTVTNPYAGTSPEDAGALIDFGGMNATAVTTEMINSNSNAVTMYLENLENAGLVLMGVEGRASYDTLRTVMNDGQLMVMSQKLDAIEAREPGSTMIARTAVRSALHVQGRMQLDFAESIEAERGVEWDAVRRGYYFPADEFPDAEAVRSIGGFTQGDKVFLPAQALEQGGRFNRIGEAYQARKASEFAMRGFEELRMDDPQTGEHHLVPLAANIRGFEKVAEDHSFLNEVDRVSRDLGIDPVDLLTVMSFETIGSFDAGQRSQASSATGLIQFMASTAEDLGVTTDELARMTRTEQMEYVERYLSPYKGRMRNLGDVYLAVHWPRAVGKPDNYVMYQRGAEGLSGRAYEVNKSLDRNGDGTVTRGETLQRVLEGTEAYTPFVSTRSLDTGNGPGPDVQSTVTVPQQPVDGLEAPSLEFTTQRDVTPSLREPTASVTPRDTSLGKIQEVLGQFTGGDVAVSQKDFKTIIDGLGFKEGSALAKYFEEVLMGDNPEEKIDLLVGLQDMFYNGEVSEAAPSLPNVQ